MYVHEPWNLPQMKIALISDIHHGPMRPSILPMVESFVAAASDQGADLLLDLGDRIDDSDRKADLRLLRELATIFQKFPGPRVHLLGNHDVVNLTDDDHEQVLGRRPGHQLVDLGKARLLLWEPSVVFHRPRGFDAAGQHLAWMVERLEEDTRAAIIASHIPVSGAAMTGNYYFGNNPALATYPDAEATRRAVEATGNAALWLSGHVHWNSVCSVGGIRHVTLQSPSETFTTNPELALTWAMLDIEEGEASLRIDGQDPLSVRFPFRRSGTRPWPAPRPPIS